MTKKLTALQASSIKLSILLLAVIIFLLVYNDCPNRSTILVLRILLSLLTLAFGFLFVRSLQLEYSSLAFKITATGASALTVLTYLYTPELINEFDRCNEPINLTVFVHGLKGKHDLVLKSEGEVIIDFNGSREREKINEFGKASFENIPPSFLNTTLSISVESAYYQISSKDKEFKLTHQRPIYIQVEKKGLNKFFGTITDELSNPIKEAKILLLNLQAISSETGYFEIDIPDSLQRKEQTITVIKQGFVTRRINNEVIDSEGSTIILQKDKSKL
jgi:hypothetical protein